MAANLLCLTAGGGIPVFSRCKGNVKQLPFPVLGSLNGVHMFCDTNGVNLQSCLTEDAKVVWKTFYDSLTLIIITQDDNASDLHLTQTLDLVFHSLVLLYGLDDLSNIKNVERFKREIRVCYQVCDRLLEAVDSSTSFSDLTGSVDVMMSTENQLLQTYLDAFVNAASSPFGFVILSGRVSVATSKWWKMDVVERVILTILVSSLPKSSSRDIPVFLPISSPKVPHRLMTFSLASDVEVCVVCGPKPTLADLQSEVVRFWKSSVDSLASLSRNFPRCFPPNAALDKNLLGFLLENTDTGVCLSSVQPFGPNDSDPSLSPSKRAKILRNFYKHVIGTVWHKNEIGAQAETQSMHLNESERLLHVASDTYVCTSTHKCYALWTGEYRLLAVFNKSLPTYAMRSVCHKTLEILMRDKNVTL
ncbi:hypothetical protein CAPTEDRAFT_17914 [Capitella teleta]|uniref:FUZ/MON1/HPS1 first Longin domain-containing protein n=1 Tax=Capitella teleta TaxID=283909 RepID=X1ZF36_CAPTE|nr:hypothetical protein CAPTEDRAFT_17914 [Capitella teleta]|eukprot:ELU10103.1 hypothetical protein CAPTEDRAFT_17914 [Capitella teleta]